MKKVIGWFIVIVFTLALLGSYVYIIHRDGWVILLGLLCSFIVAGIFFLGIYLITDNK